MDNFKEYQQEGHIQTAIDIHVRVLTTGYWPTQAMTSLCTLPHVAADAYKTFKDFYLGRHNGRKLTLQAQLGHAELNAIFYGPVSRGGDGDEGGEPSAGPSRAAGGKMLNFA